MSEPVLYDVERAIATITLNRPEAMNGLDVPTKEALLDVLGNAASDESVRCVVLTGSGRAFCVGQDLKEHIGLIQSGADTELLDTVERHYNPIVHTIAGMQKPVVAALNGVAAGAGLSLAMACDLRIAAESAGCNTSFAGVALSCDTGASWTLPRLVGHTRAMDLLLFPRTISAAEALEIGLLNRVVPDAELGETVADVASRLASGPTVAFGSIKQAVAFSASHSLSESTSFEAGRMRMTGRTKDHHDAVAAFMEKRTPNFEGH